MPAGIEVIDQGGTNAALLTSDNTFFRLEGKGSFWAPGAPNGEYNYSIVNIDIPFSGNWNDSPCLAIRCGRAVSYYVRSIDSGVIRYTFSCSPNQTVEWWLFSRRGPGWSNSGIQIFHGDGSLAYDAGTPVMFPLGDQFDQQHWGRTIGVILANYHTEYEYTLDSWDDPDTYLFNRYETWVRSIEGCYVEGNAAKYGAVSWARITDSGHIYRDWQGSGGNFIESGSTNILVVDLTGI